MTGLHGKGVTEIIASHLPDAKYHFITAVQRDGNVDDKELLFAFQTVLDHAELFDVVNISAGLYHAASDKKECTVNNPSCSVCELAEEVIEAGVPIVAGSGKAGDGKGLCCPSITQECISVSGILTKCGYTPDSNSWEPGADSKPPNALWIEHPDEEGFTQAYCSGRGCFPGETCAKNRLLETADCNPEPKNGKPNIMAPCIWPHTDSNNNYALATGTSYAAPCVTAVVGNVLTAIRQYDCDPSVPSVRASLEKSARSISDSSIPIVDGEEFADHLATKYGFSVDYNRHDSDLERLT